MCLVDVWSAWKLIKTWFHQLKYVRAVQLMSHESHKKNQDDSFHSEAQQYVKGVHSSFFALINFVYILLPPIAIIIMRKSSAIHLKTPKNEVRWKIKDVSCSVYKKDSKIILRLSSKVKRVNGSLKNKELKLIKL